MYRKMVIISLKTQCGVDYAQVDVTQRKIPEMRDVDIPYGETDVENSNQNRGHIGKQRHTCFQETELFKEY